MSKDDHILGDVLDASHVLIACLDRSFNFVRVNRAYAEADGQVPDSFPGKNHFDLYPNAENEEIFCRVVQTGEASFASAKTFTYANHPERGVSYWDWLLAPTRDPNGAVDGLVLSLVNVTAREQARNFLCIQRDLGLELSMASTLEALLDAVLKASIAAAEMDSGGIYWIDPDGALRLACHRGLSDAFVQAVARHSPDSEQAQIARRGQPVFSSCGVVAMGSDSPFRKEGLRAFTGMPMKRDNEVIAWINVASHEKADVSERCHSALETIASMAGGPLAATLSARQHQICLRNSIEGFGVVDQAGRFIEVNDSLCGMLGYTRHELLGMRIPDIEAQETPGDTRRRMQRIRETGRDRFFSRQRRKDGVVLDVEVSAQYTEIRGGVYFAFIRDVTELVCAQERLRRSEALYRSFVENFHGIAYRAVPETWTPQFFHGAVEEMTGYQEADFVAGHPRWDEIIFPADLAALKAGAAKDLLARADVVHDREYRIVRKDGAIRWVRDTAKCVRRDDGVGNVLLGTVQDITAWKTTAEALRRSEQRYALAQRAAMVGSWEWDISTGELFWSDTIEAMFGFEPGGFGKTYEAFLASVHPEDRQRVTAVVEEAVREKTDYAIEHRIVWPDGSVKWVAETGGVERDTGGKAVRMFGVVQDITLRRRGEIALRSILEGTSGVTGESFFRELVRHLAMALEVKYAFVARLSNDAKSAQTLVVWSGSDFGDNFAYELAGTPCEQVLTSDRCCHPHDVQASFPRDHLLATMGVESYWGRPLRDSGGRTIGIMAVLDDKPMNERSTTDSVLRVFAMRCATELERQDMLCHLEAHAHDLENFNTALVGRETRVIELKEEVNALAHELGRAIPYPPVWDPGANAGDLESEDGRQEA